LFIFATAKSGSSSVGRASAFQAECRRFEPGLPLKKKSHQFDETFFILIHLKMYQDQFRKVLDCVQKYELVSFLLIVNYRL
jgi:hypothetical protein